MGERTEFKAGTFSWVELLTSDEAGAKAFYGALLGWDWEDVPLPEGGTYTLVLKDGKRVAGLHQPAPENAGPPAWLSYVAVIARMPRPPVRPSSARACSPGPST